MRFALSLQHGLEPRELLAVRVLRDVGQLQQTDPAPWVAPGLPAPFGRTLQLPSSRAAPALRFVSCAMAGRSFVPFAGAHTWTGCVACAAWTCGT